MRYSLGIVNVRVVVAQPVCAGTRPKLTKREHDVLRIAAEQRREMDKDFYADVSQSEGTGPAELK